MANRIVFTGSNPNGRSVKVRWDQYAGCSCPCSPGFVVTRGYTGKDLSVSVGD